MNLLKMGRPPTVVRRVIAVVVDPVNSQARRHLAHIGEEVGEAVRPRPPLTDGYTASSVILKAAHPRVRAARFHRLPTAVCRSPRHVMGQVLRPPYFIPQAATRRCLSAAEPAGPHVALSSAVAPTPVPPARSVSWDFLDDHQTAIALPRENYWRGQPHFTAKATARRRVPAAKTASFHLTNDPAVATAPVPAVTHPLGDLLDHDQTAIAVTGEHYGWRHVLNHTQQEGPP